MSDPIPAILTMHGRDDGGNVNHISAALAYLKKQEKANNPAYGKWTRVALETTEAPARTGASDAQDQLADGGETDQDEALLRDHRDNPAGRDGDDQHRSVVAN